MPNYIDPSKYTVVGLSGIANSGKDYLAKKVLVSDLGFIPLSIAQWFKCEGVQFEDLPFEQTFGDESKDDDVRSFYQNRGTELGREKHGRDVWINIVEMYMYFFRERGFNKFVISDIRYPNESDWIKEFDGKVYRITGRGGAESEKTQNHKSETAMGGYDKFDGYIDNSEEHQERAPKILKTMVCNDFHNLHEGQDTEGF